MKDSKHEISARQRLGITLYETYQHVFDKSQVFFEKFGLTSQQFNVLSILDEADTPLSTSDILKRMIEKNAGVSRLVDRLILKGLIEKKINVNDRRLIDIKLTSDGEKLCKQVFSRLSEIEEIYGSLTDKEVETLSNLLSKLIVQPPCSNN